MTHFDFAFISDNAECHRSRLFVGQYQSLQSKTGAHFGFQNIAWYGIGGTALRDREKLNVDSRHHSGQCQRLSRLRFGKFDVSELALLRGIGRRVSEWHDFELELPSRFFVRHVAKANTPLIAQS